MGSKQKLYPATQQGLLREAMTQLVMTREELAARLSVSKRTLDKWLLPSESSDFRALPEMGRAYIHEILVWHSHNSGSGLMR